MPRTKTGTRATTDKDRALAQHIGHRIREARHRAGLTQQQLAGDRYTKAYVSALETGIARPSMVALRYLSERLGLPASHFIDEAHPAWTRLEVDMRLAQAIGRQPPTATETLLDDATDDAARVDLLRGLAEASARMDRGKEAVAAASEAARIYADAGREADAALARYWLAYGLYQSDNEVDARSILAALLEQVRGGLRVEPDFEMRLLTSLAAVESRAGQAARALTYLEEARGLSADLDDRRRAAFLFNLAIDYREVGDYEAAIRAGTQGMALYRAAGRDLRVRADRERPRPGLPRNRPGRPGPRAGRRRAAPDRGDRRRALDGGRRRHRGAGRPGGRRRGRGAAAGRARAWIRRPERQRVRRPDGDAHRGASPARRPAEVEEAEVRFAEAARIARASRAPSRLREVLREWADLRAEPATTAVRTSSPARRSRSIEC